VTSNIHKYPAARCAFRGSSALISRDRRHAFHAFMGSLTDVFMGSVWSGLVKGFRDCSGARVKRALGVQAALEWAFRVEKAQLELPPPKDVIEEGFGFGLE
jgi:hypothetical protein